MIKYIHHFWDAWGRDTRRNPPCWPTKSVLWRILKEQGAQGGEFGPRIPKIEYSEQDFYRAQAIWRTMPENLQQFTFIFYAQPLHWRQKITILGVTKHRLYQMRDQLHEYTEARL